MQFIERAKCEVEDSLAFFFDYEMQVLNYDRVISPEERQRRFTELIRKVDGNKLDPDNDDQKSITLLAKLEGP